MTNTVRDAVFEHEMFELYHVNSGFTLDHLRRVEVTWNFAEDQILDELRQMTLDGLIHEDSGYWSSTTEGKAQREKQWQAKGRRHPTLTQQTSDLSDLILALVASAYNDLEGGDGARLHPNALPMYLWRSSADAIDGVLRSLIERNLVRSAELFRIGEPRLLLTADGQIEYSKRVVARLGLVPPYTILAPLEKPKPAFMGIGFQPLFADNLAYRWEEAERCEEARAWLAATILYGSILESILLAVLTNEKEAAFTSPKAPKDRNGKAFADIEQWKLESMLNVAADLGFFDPALLKHGHALRDSRNLVHPMKQMPQLFRGMVHGS